MAERADTNAIERLHEEFSQDADRGTVRQQIHIAA
jgi:hypothetical protein